MIALVLPAITSIEAGPAPRNGMCRRSIPASILKYSMPVWSEPPVPPEAYWMSPGLALASAMNSLTDLAGRSGWTASMFGLVTNIAIGSHALAGSNGSL